MTLVEFYIKILKEVNIFVTEDGFLQAEDRGELKLLKRTKRHLEIALPKKELLDNMFVLNQNNKYIQNYLLFNPLCEKSLEDGVGLDILKDFVVAKFNMTLLGLGTLLIGLYDAPTLQGDLPMDINLFLKDLKDTNIPGMKGSGKPIDKTSLDKWNKLIVSYVESLDKQLFNLVIPRTKKAAVKDSPTRESRLTLSLYNDLKEVVGTDEPVEVNGVKLKPKEVKVFWDIVNMFMDGCNAKGCIAIATNDIEAPGFISLMTLYYKVMVRLNKLVRAMREVDPEVADDIIATLDYDINEIENAPANYKKELLQIPSENEINMGVDMVNGANNVNMNIKNIHQGLQTAVQVAQQPMMPNNQNDVVPFQPDLPKTPMDAMLNKIATDRQAALMGRPPVVNTGTLPPYVTNPQVANMPVPEQPVVGGNPVRTVSRFSPHLNTPETMEMLRAETVNRPVETNNMGYGYTPNASPAMPPRPAPMPMNAGMPVMPMPMQNNMPMHYPQMGMPATGMMGPVRGNGWNGYPPVQNNGYGWPVR